MDDVSLPLISYIIEIPCLGNQVVIRCLKFLLKVLTTNGQRIWLLKTRNKVSLYLTKSIPLSLVSLKQKSACNFWSSLYCSQNTWICLKIPTYKDHNMYIAFQCQWENQRHSLYYYYKNTATIPKSNNKKLTFKNRSLKNLF